MLKFLSKTELMTCQSLEQQSAQGRYKLLKQVLSCLHSATASHSVRWLILLMISGVKADLTQPN
jgi:hypothetical protein